MNAEFRPEVLQRCQEAVESNTWVQVGSSWIRGADLGLFAKVGIRKGQVLTCYMGERLVTRDAICRKDKSYLMRIGPELYIDSIDSKFSLARYINDCRTKTGYNVMFLKSRCESCAWVISTRDINKGEELFVDYGRWYWAGASVKPNPLSFFSHTKFKNALV